MYIFRVRINYGTWDKTQNTDRVLQFHTTYFLFQPQKFLLLLFLENILFIFVLDAFRVLFPLHKKPEPDFLFHKWLLLIREFFLFIQEKINPFSSTRGSVMTWLNLFGGRLPDWNPNSAICNWNLNMVIYLSISYFLYL